MKAEELRQNHSSSKLVDWRYRVTVKELYQLTESTFLKNIQQE